MSDANTDLTMTYLREIRALLTQIAQSVLLTRQELMDAVGAMNHHIERTNSWLIDIEKQIIQLPTGITHRLDGVNGRLDRFEAKAAIGPSD